MTPGVGSLSPVTSEPLLVPPVVVMGVSGSGKSTVGAALAAAIGVGFIDADDLHSAANKAKMAAGIPLTHADRQPCEASGRPRTAAREAMG